MLGVSNKMEVTVNGIVLNNVFVYQEHKESKMIDILVDGENTKLNHLEGLRDGCNIIVDRDGHVEEFTTGLVGIQPVEEKSLKYTLFVFCTP